MCTSDKKLIRHIIGNLISSIWFAFFGAIYEHFSHEVYSYYMIYSFAVPLCMGALPYSIMMLKGYKPNKAFLNLWNSAIAAFTVGSVFKGVLDIYGTTNKLIIVYPIIGVLLSATALIVCIISVINANKPKEISYDSRN